jgi:protein-lysine N-methyltransferase EEF2KMT
MGTTIIDHGRVINTSSGAATTGVPSEGLTDPRNADILIWVGDRLCPRERATLSVFDSSVQGGDAVWEGVRIYGNRLFKLEAHMDRLQDSARALAYEGVPSREFIRSAVRKTLIGRWLNIWVK